MEETTIQIPYIRYKSPPRDFDVPSMLQEAHKKLDSWVETLNPKLKVYDALHLKQMEKERDGLTLTYTVIRNKIKPEEEKGE